MLHDGLLRGAGEMIPSGQGRPSQALRRRAISTAYYAAFHRFIHDASRLFLSGERATLRNYVRRAFGHFTMQRVCSIISSGGLPKRWPQVASDVPDELRTTCRLFFRLQEDRHKADYDQTVTFSKAGAITRVAQAEELFRLADKLSTDHRDVYEAFLVALLVQGNVR